ncbi:MAG TPA: NADH-quinone oxidoreductase subunit L, partial [Terriglobales bacterium]|nr:NADH-quinone oxidoreductase subunit L [Terriglobales bacterium]
GTGHHHLDLPYARDAECRPRELVETVSLNMNVNLNLWLIPILPLLGALINGAMGRRFSKTLVGAIALGASGAAFAYALWVVSQFGGLAQVPYVENHSAWIQITDFSVNYGFQLDQLSVVMLMVVTGVGFLIHIYSVGYMHDDDGYYRFFAYLNLFMFFMLVLVLANNYLLMFVGWEGVGLASYLLIGFYFLKDSASQAGKKAFIVNRIGDFAFLLGMFLMVKYFGSLDFNSVFTQASTYPVENGSVGLLTLIGFCLLIGACGKSAQVPLYVWLPDAMEGPTPVSALIHAATMVTAGVYMVARSHAIYNHAPKALLAVAVVGAVTAIFAATIGMVQTDIKRVLAYSTVSQLGYMFLACGVAAYSAGVFHLMTHAFFKALLFLSAGSVIHAMGGEQDMRFMGGLKKYIPVTRWVMTIGTLAIAGIPGLAGFFSKDEILWQAYSSEHGHPILWVLGIITALMTSFYMFRLLFMTFHGELRSAPSGGHDPHAHDSHGHGTSHATTHASPHESPWVMLAPLVILAGLSVVGGWVGVPHALGGNNRFEKFLAPVFERYERPEKVLAASATQAPHAAGSESAAQHESAAAGTPPEGAKAEPHQNTSQEITLTAISVLVAFAGWFAAWFLYVRRPELPERIAASMGGLYRTVLNKYYVDEGYQEAIVDPIVKGSTEVLWKRVDVGVIDATVNGAGSSAKFFSNSLRRMQSGNLRSYAGWVAFGAAALLGYMVWMGLQ